MSWKGGATLISNCISFDNVLLALSVNLCVPCFQLRSLTDGPGLQRRQRKADRDPAGGELSGLPCSSHYI